MAAGKRRRAVRLRSGLGTAVLTLASLSYQAGGWQSDLLAWILGGGAALCLLVWIGTWIRLGSDSKQQAEDNHQASTAVQSQSQSPGAVAANISGPVGSLIINAPNGEQAKRRPEKTTREMEQAWAVNNARAELRHLADRGAGEERRSESMDHEMQRTILLGWSRFALGKVIEILGETGGREFRQSPHIYDQVVTLSDYWGGHIEWLMKRANRLDFDDLSSTWRGDQTAQYRRLSEALRLPPPGKAPGSPHRSSSPPSDAGTSSGQENA